MSQETSTPARPNAATSEYAKKLGIVCERVQDDRAVYSMAFRTDNVTVADVVHGGAICSLADVAATGAAWSAVTEPALAEPGLQPVAMDGFGGERRGPMCPRQLFRLERVLVRHQ